ncbi:patatin-like phospholipase family protein [Microbacterium sp. M3]|uniref:Patatin-like phospholipase family protein n=1 Tax=Microbacterium arthrosphaerae TaxID=792652 RepID=A0ABU4H587_9MICO|nr:MULTISPECIES: patatin-like phospholipase family protein [Microbacterium]MDW4574521.1 patatin-like phospholipase family protein [Microbacterium arthrosphaerae]MDW7608376.1 patatin-like phospholipase family protein [Microbacterium sp. M3]
MSVAFVLGGGGVRGAVEIGMLRALLERGIRPDLVVGTSIGAINGALVASDPSPAVIDRLLDAWTSPEANAVYGDSLFAQFTRLVKTRTHLNSPAPLRHLLERALGAGTRFEDLPVRLQVVAASIERAAEHVFASGPLVEAILASASVPGLLPPTRIGDEHFIDGGIVNSIPIAQAVDAGATTVFVLQVGRIETPLVAPRSAVETARVAFEIARRHRYARDLATLPEGVDLHVLPSGGGPDDDDSLMSYRRMDTVRARIDAAYDASRAFLVDRGLGPDGAGGADGAGRESGPDGASGADGPDAAGGAEGGG